MNINKEIAIALNCRFDGNRLVERQDTIEYEVITDKQYSMHRIEFDPKTNWLQTSVLLNTLVQENISVIAMKGKRAAITSRSSTKRITER